MTAAYVPGDFLAVLAHETLLVWEPRAAISADDLWKAAESGAAIHELVGLLAVEAGWSNLPAFAIVRPETGRVRILVRGDVDVHVNAPGRPEEVVAAPLATTWAESVVDDASSVSVLAGDARRAQALPLVSGVVPASRFTWVFAGASASTETPDAPFAEPGFGDSWVPGITQIPELTQAPETAPVETTPVETAPVETAPVETAPVETAAPGALETPDEAPVEHSVSYAFLFGGGDERSVSRAAVRPDMEPEGDGEPEGDTAPEAHAVPEADAVPTLAAPLPTLTQPPVPEPLPDPLADEPTGLISHAPWSLGGRSARLGDHDDLTVSRASLNAPDDPPTSRPAGGPTTKPADGEGPLLLSVACPGGHRNGPDALTCRVCAEPIPPQTPVSVRRPPLGVLRLGTGEEFPLDRLTIVGRLPKAHGMVGTELPRLVTVPAPNQDVSRSHLELRLDGWQLLAVDLDSLNGTVVTLPGRPPQRVRANLPLIVSPGTTLVLADEVTLTIEASAARGAQT